MASEQLRKPTESEDPERLREREFVEAVRRVYRKYGTDLSAFRRDIESDLAKRERSSET